MLVLIEGPNGYTLFTLKNDKLLKKGVDDIQNLFSTPEKAREQVARYASLGFTDNKQAVEEICQLEESKMGSGLKSLLKAGIVKRKSDKKCGIIVEDVRGLGEKALKSLVVVDKTLGAAIKDKFGLNIVYSPETMEIVRGIRGQISSLLSDIDAKGLGTMSVGLGHALNRFKLRFSPEKVDVMIVQGIGLLDDLDKELNNFGMRLKEWYGWHFPELATMVVDNGPYAEIVLCLGPRTNAASKLGDLEKIVSEGVAEEIVRASSISMGMEVTSEDLANISELAERLLRLSEYRSSLADYLKIRMEMLAPNLTHMVGELVGARLIAKSGSLMSLAKQPASTIQVLGAEKALFRALKTKSPTPKYGIIYHSSLIGQAAPKIKGKISRILAAKLALCMRVDALRDQTQPTLALANKEYVQRRILELGNDAPDDPHKSPAVKPGNNKRIGAPNTSPPAKRFKA